MQLHQITNRWRFDTWYEQTGPDDRRKISLFSRAVRLQRESITWSESHFEGYWRSGSRAAHLRAGFELGKKKIKPPRPFLQQPESMWGWSGKILATHDSRMSNAAPGRKQSTGNLSQPHPGVNSGGRGGGGWGGCLWDTLSQINMLAVRLHALQMFAEAFAPNSPSKRLLKINDQPRRLLPEVSPGLRYFLGTS